MNSNDNNKDILQPINDFERQLIAECKKDGMTDEEISKWLKQL